MTVALYTNIVSPHQLPLAREIASLVGEINYRYIFREPFHNDRKAMGWSAEFEPWIIGRKEQPKLTDEWLRECEVLLCGIRDLDLMESRAKCGKKTFYTSERWFKPFGLMHDRIQIPGRVRMLHPKYCNMARRFVAMTKKYDSF